MRRRDALRGLGTLAALPVTGVRARPPRPGPSQADDYAPIASLSLPGAKEAVVSDDGSTAFVAATDGFVVVDLSEPAAPSVVHENRAVLSDRENGPLKQVYDVKRDGDLLAVVGPANPIRDALSAAVVFDVSDPTAPSRVSVHETGFFNHNCDIADGTVYLCGNDGGRNPLVTVDAATGEELGRWSVLSQDETWKDVPFVNWPLHDVWVQDGVAHLAYWDAGSWLIDVSDPAEPTVIARVRGGDAERFAGMSRSDAFTEGRQPPGNDHFVRPDESGDLLAISVEAWDATPDDPSQGGPGPVHLYDISEPQAPEQLATIDAPPTDDPTMDGPWTTSHNFDFRGDRLYTSWYSGGVRVYDVSDPASPALLRAWRDTDTTSFWTAQAAVADRFFIASSATGGDPHDRSAVYGDARLYTFPDPPADAAPIATPTPSPNGPPTSTPTETPHGSSPPSSPSPTPVPSPTPTPSETPTPTETSTDPSTTTGTGPGFGPLAALAGIGLGTWRYLRANREQ